MTRNSLFWYRKCWWVNFFLYFLHVEFTFRTYRSKNLVCMLYHNKVIIIIIIIIYFTHFLFLKFPKNYIKNIQMNTQFLMLESTQKYFSMYFSFQYSTTIIYMSLFPLYLKIGLEKNYSLYYRQTLLIFRKLYTS